MFSILTRSIWAAATAALVVVGGSACTPTGKRAPTVNVGTQLREFGPQSVGRGALPHPAPGSTYYIGMPQYVNAGNGVVTVTGISLAGVSRNVRVILYILLSVKDFDGASLLDWDPKLPSDGVNFDKAAR